MTKSDNFFIKALLCLIAGFTSKIAGYDVISVILLTGGGINMSVSLWKLGEE